MKSILSSILALTTLVSLQTVHAAKLDKVRLIGMEANREAPARAIVEQALSGNADANRSDANVDVSLVQLDSKIVFTMVLKEKNGVTRQKQLNLASFDEIDVGAQRLVSSLFEGLELSETASRNKVVEAEQTRPARVRSLAGFEVGMGAGFPITDYFVSHRPVWVFGVGYLWDVDRFLIEWRGDFSFGFDRRESGSFTTSIGTHYVFYDSRQFALFAGPQFGFGNYGTESKKMPIVEVDAKGFFTGADVGAVLLRHADVNVDLRARIGVLTNTLNDVVPVTGGLFVGIRF